MTSDLHAPEAGDGIVTWLDRPEPVIGGVAADVALRLGAHRLLVRCAFAVLALAAGAGLVVYGLGWLLLHGRPCPEPSRPGIRSDVAIIALAGSVLAFSTAAVPELPARLLWLVLLVTLGLAVAVAPQADGTNHVADLAFGSGRARTAVGVILMVAAVATALAAGQGPAELWQSMVALAVLVVGLGLVAAPWLSQLRATARIERLERIRVEERADIATHLHDSVLQTLTLIQNRASEPQVIAALAHQQERELRRWLYGSPTAGDGGGETLRSALDAVAADVEDQYLVAVEAIIIGDRPLEPALQAMVAATREALLNAAKFSGTQLISIFADVEVADVSIYVRDRGAGFDLAAVPADRRGIAESIVGRVERVGGTVAIRTAPGDGTEVALTLALAAADTNGVP